MARRSASAYEVSLASTCELAANSADCRLSGSVVVTSETDNSVFAAHEPTITQDQTLPLFPEGTDVSTLTADSVETYRTLTLWPTAQQPIVADRQQVCRRGLSAGTTFGDHCFRPASNRNPPRKENKMTLNRTFFLAAFALLTAFPAAAQTTILGIRDVDEEIDDLRRDAEISINRGNDARRFGPSEQREGLSGSLSLSYSGSAGPTEDQDLSFGARLTDVRGPLVQSLGFILSFSEVNSTRTAEDIFAIYDLTYDWNTNFYGFAIGRLNSNGLAATAGEIDTDAFIGVGPGIRVINRPDMTWRLQAGAGLSYLKYGDGRDESEPGGIASSRFYAQLGENVYLTNDADLLSSDTAFRASNDLGLNFKVSDALSTRVSYLTEYNDSRNEDTQNKLTFSLVYGF
ncbi:DUF481 domain-containing protein [Frigidibacter sp. SD6-1]|uniref:DUF481 domain-containing protein n=1 Tax=Frigidibacter sp. SD6-1 TaxID=3032581 RepID=UPI0024E040E9|nr:DUF481 domain-containing protein [Frigidibacter sp. SD6-1]